MISHSLKILLGRGLFMLITLSAPCLAAPKTFSATPNAQAPIETSEPEQPPPQSAAITNLPSGTVHEQTTLAEDADRVANISPRERLLAALRAHDLIGTQQAWLEHQLSDNTDNTPHEAMLEALMPAPAPPTLTRHRTNQATVLGWLLDRNIISPDTFAAQILNRDLRYTQNVYILRTLLEHGQNLNIRTFIFTNNRPVLHAYTEYLMRAHIRVALEHGADPNTVDSTGNTAIHCLFNSLHTTPPPSLLHPSALDVLTLLLDAQVPVEHRNHAQQTALELLAQLPNIPARLASNLREYIQARLAAQRRTATIRATDHALGRRRHMHTAPQQIPLAIIPALTRTQHTAFNIALTEAQAAPRFQEDPCR
ncbi:MAG TPA: hypothetical protein PLV25_01750 [Opitutales bacterium]|nr:hypothetical protein [Opitutales bacterium]